MLTLHAPTRLVTFDTYGTLIDWDTALAAALEPLLIARGWPESATAFYRLWYVGHLLPAVRDEPYRPYRVLLQDTLQQALATQGLEARPTDGSDLGDRMAAALPFPDAPDVLRQLRERYFVATISNSEDDIIAHSAELLGRPFDVVFTAEATSAYKPAPPLFELVMRHFDVEPRQVVHVAQSQFVDLPRSVPLGIPTVWINRHGQQLADGIPAPDVTLANLSTLPALLAQANDVFDNATVGRLAPTTGKAATSQ